MKVSSLKSFLVTSFKVVKVMAKLSPAMGAVILLFVSFKLTVLCGSPVYDNQTGVQVWLGLMAIITFGGGIASAIFQIAYLFEKSNRNRY